MRMVANLLQAPNQRAVSLTIRRRRQRGLGVHFSSVVDGDDGCYNQHRTDECCASGLVDWLVLLVGWFVGWLIGWLIGWLVD